MNKHGDAALVEDCLRGDGDALVVLIERYEKPIYNAAFRMLKDPDDARDVTQTVCLKAMENLASYDPRYKFYSWVYRIAINESLNWIKRRDRAGGRTTDEIPSPPACALTTGVCAFGRMCVKMFDRLFAPIAIAAAT